LRRKKNRERLSVKKERNKSKTAPVPSVRPAAI
jgi:hypothetical protein